MRSNITVGGWEEGGRSTPGGRVRPLRCDIRRNGRSEKAPYSDPSAIPQVGKDSTSKQVELRSVGPGVGVEEATTTIIASAARALVVDDV